MKWKIHFAWIIFLLMSEHGYLDCPEGLSLSCQVATVLDTRAMMTCPLNTEWMNLCETLSVTCTLDGIDDNQSGMMTGCSTICQCVLTPEDIQNAFNKSQSTLKPSSNAMCDGTTSERSQTVPLTTQQNSPTMSTSTTASAKDPTHQVLCQCQVILGILGALVSLLLMLLMIVTTGWAWMCWTMKERVRISNNFSPNPPWHSLSTHANNTTQETPLKGNNSLPAPGTSLNSLAAASTCMQQISLEDATSATNEETDSCEHMYHVLEQLIGNDYEELDKYKKKGWSREDISYTLNGPAVEGEGPEGGASINNNASEEYKLSVPISTNGN